jgi:flagellar protein FliO/FliZ
MKFAGAAGTTLALLAATLAPMLARAQAAAGSHPVEGPSILPMVMALILVLAMIAATMWVLRRTGIAPRNPNNPIKLVGQLPVGPRERVVLVEIGDRWWLLGVASGGVTRLGSVPKGETPTPATLPASFGNLLDKLRKGAS